MKWLITGGCGFIGRSLIAKLISETGNQIRVLDNLSVGSREDLFEICDFTEKSPDECLEWGEAVELIVGDILSDITTLQVCVGADVIVHLAANTGVGPSVDDPMSDCKTNVIGTLNVLEACRSNSINRFVFASSGAPLGVQVPPLHEEMAPHPASPYGASKLAGEGYCSAYYHCFGVNTVVLRFGNVYGEGSKHKASVVAKFIKSAMNGEDLEIYGDGLQTRDFIHILDLVKAIYKASTIPDIGGEKFQIASASETTVTELVDLLLDRLEAEGISKPKVYNGEKRDGDVQRNFSDTSKARDQLNWTAEIQLADGLSRTIKFFKNCN